MSSSRDRRRRTGIPSAESRGHACTSLVLLFLFAVGAVACRGDLATGRPGNPRLVVLALEGVPRETLERLVASGALPAFASLFERGKLSDLPGEPSVTDLPVSWTTIATGLPPSEHGILGWLAPRDPGGFAATGGEASLPRAASPEESGGVLESLLVEPGASRLGGLLRRPVRFTRLARGEPFWVDMAHRGQSAALLGMPFSFPPSAGPTVRVLSGPSAPGFGEAPAPFTVLTSDPLLPAGDVPGGRIIPLDFSAGQAQVQVPSPRVSAGPRPPVAVDVSREEGNAVRVRMGGVDRRLELGAWSEPIVIPAQAPFDRRPAFRVRFRLERIDPTLVLYIGPAVPPPSEREIPLSQPPGFAGELESRFGPLQPDDLEAATAAVSVGLLAPSAAGEIAIEEVARLRRMVLQQIDLRRAELVVAVFTEVGSLLRAAALSRGPAGPQVGVERVHRALDELLEDVVTHLGDGSRLVVLSTRGGARLDRRLDLAGWLASFLPRGVVAEVPSGGQVWLRSEAAQSAQRWGAGGGLDVGPSASAPLSEEHREAAIRDIEANAPSLRDATTGESWIVAVERCRRPLPRGSTRVTERAPDLLVRLRIAAGPPRLGTSGSECVGFVCDEPAWPGLAAGGLDAASDRGWILTSWPLDTAIPVSRESLAKRLIEWLAASPEPPSPARPAADPRPAGGG